jgi:hypothetical protein
VLGVYEDESDDGGDEGEIKEESEDEGHERPAARDARGGPVSLQLVKVMADAPGDEGEEEGRHRLDRRVARRDRRLT